MWYSLQRTHTRDKYITDTHSPCGTVHSGLSRMRQVHHRHTQPMWYCPQWTLVHGTSTSQTHTAYVVQSAADSHSSAKLFKSILQHLMLLPLMNLLWFHQLSHIQPLTRENGTDHDLSCGSQLQDIYSEPPLEPLRKDDGLPSNGVWEIARKEPMQ